MKKIEFQDKVSPDIVTSGDINEIKDVVNENADYLAALSTQLIWQDPVKNIVSSLPTSGLTVGDRYILSTDTKIYTATSSTAFGAGVLPEIGWAAMITTLGYIYSFNGTAWKNTGLKAFPELEQVPSNATDKAPASKLLYVQLMQLYKSYNSDWNLIGFANIGDAAISGLLNDIYIPTSNGSVFGKTISDYKTQILLCTGTNNYSVITLDNDKYVSQVCKLYSNWNYKGKATANTPIPATPSIGDAYLCDTYGTVLGIPYCYKGNFIMYDGVKYDQRAIINSQFKEIKLSDLFVGYYPVGNNASLGTTMNDTTPAGLFGSIRIDVNEGDLFRIKGVGGASPRLWAVTDSSGNILSRAADSLSQTASYAEVIMPAGATTIQLCFNKSSVVSAYYIRRNENYSNKSYINSRQNAIKISSIYESVNGVQITPISTVSNSYIDSVGGASVTSEGRSWKKYAVKYGKRYKLIVDIDSDVSGLVYAQYSDDLFPYIISGTLVSRNAGEAKSYVLNIPVNALAKQIRVNGNCELYEINKTVSELISDNSLTNKDYSGVSAIGGETDKYIDSVGTSSIALYGRNWSKYPVDPRYRYKLIIDIDSDVSGLVYAQYSGDSFSNIISGTLVSRSAGASQTYYIDITPNINATQIRVNGNSKLYKLNLVKTNYDLFKNDDLINVGSNVCIDSTSFSSLISNPYYLRIPFGDVTNTGKIIVGCDIRENNISDQTLISIGIMTSSDNGNTYSNPQVIIPRTSLSATDRRMDATILIDKNKTSPHYGRIYVFAHKITGTEVWENINVLGSYSMDFVYVYSDDDGLTWSSEVSLKSLFPTYAVTMFGGVGNGITMKNGTLILPVQAKMAVNEAGIPSGYYNIQSGFIYSTNNGATWTMSKLVQAYTSECNIIEYAEGKLILNARSYISGRRIFFTEDMGNTWTPHPSDKTLIEPVACQGSFVKLQYGYKAVGLFTNPFDLTARKNLALQATKNYVDYYPLFCLNSGNYSGYSCIITNKTGKVYVAFETNGSSIKISDLSTNLNTILSV